MKNEVLSECYFHMKYNNGYIEIETGVEGGVWMQGEGNIGFIHYLS